MCNYQGFNCFLKIFMTINCCVTLSWWRCVCCEAARPRWGCGCAAPRGWRAWTCGPMRGEHWGHVASSPPIAAHLTSSVDRQKNSSSSSSPALGPRPSRRLPAPAPAPTEMGQKSCILTSSIHRHQDNINYRDSIENV